MFSYKLTIYSLMKNDFVLTNNDTIQTINKYESEADTRYSI